MFGHMHGVLNMDKITNQLHACKLRDKSFEPNCAMILKYSATVNIC